MTTNLTQAALPTVVLPPEQIKEAIESIRQSGILG